MAKGELNIALLEERTTDGWAGRAAITCPCGCGVETVYVVTSSLEGRGIGFWEAVEPHTVTRQTMQAPRT